jgi:hypothetical protein
MEEARGDFKPEHGRWYQKGLRAGSRAIGSRDGGSGGTQSADSADSDGKPGHLGFTEADAGGANWGFEPHNEPFTPVAAACSSIRRLEDCPYQPWARAEKAGPHTPARGYDDSDRALLRGRRSASLYVPSPFYIIQTPTVCRDPARTDVVAHHPAGRTRHLPDTIRLWQGDSLGRWDGDTLVVETTNLNGKTWLNEVGRCHQPCGHGRRTVHAV